MYKRRLEELIRILFLPVSLYGNQECMCLLHPRKTQTLLYFIKPGAVLDTGEAGSRPGRHFFMTREGRHEHLKKIIWAAKRFSIFYHITVWGIGKLAPAAAAGAPAC